MKFITYDTVEIMVCNFDELEFYVNDQLFYTMEEAKRFIDEGCPMSQSFINVYRNGGF